MLYFWPSVKNVIISVISDSHFEGFVGFVWDRANFLHSSWVELCFGFFLKTALITWGCFNYYPPGLTPCQGPFCLSLHPISEWAGVHQKLGWDTTLTADPNWAKIWHILWHHAQCIKLWEEEGNIWNDGIFLPTCLLHVMGPTLLEKVEHLCAHCKWWINSLFCFACVCNFCFAY